MKDLIEILAALGFVSFLMIVATGIVGASFKFWIDLLGYAIPSQKPTPAIDRLTDNDFSRKLDWTLNQPGTQRQLRGDGGYLSDVPAFYVTFGAFKQGPDGSFYQQHTILLSADDIEVVK